MATVATPRSTETREREDRRKRKAPLDSQARKELMRDRVTGMLILLFYLAVIGLILWFATGTTVPDGSYEPLMFW